MRLKVRILLTNDDGMHAEGICSLAARLAPRAQVLVVAPDSPNSATSHCITLHKPLRLTPAKRFGAECGGAHGIEAYACSGTPSDCVMLGALYLWRDNPPDLVISGINDGENVAQDLSYSGTVGGALEGAVCGIPSLAVSLRGTQRASFSQAAELVDLLISLLVYGRCFTWNAIIIHALSQNNIANGINQWELAEQPVGAGESYPAPGPWPPTGLTHAPCLNVNIPDLPLKEIRGIAWAAAGQREYRDVVKETLDPRGKPYYWIAGDKVRDDAAPGTDTHVLARGYVAVTPVTYDITTHSGLARLSAWLRERPRR
jgi:5'-nucleotidase